MQEYCYDTQRMEIPNERILFFIKYVSLRRDAVKYCMSFVTIWMTNQNRSQGQPI